MKKIFNCTVTLLSFILLSINLFGQSFGLGTGINFSNQKIYSSDPDIAEIFEDDGYKYLLGFNAGVYYDFCFTDQLAFRACLAYSSKGYAYNSEFNSPSSYLSLESQTRLNYIQINPMLKYSLPLGDNSLFYALIGPYMGIGVNGKSNMNLTSFEINGDGNVFNYVKLTSSDKIQFGENGNGIDFFDFGLTPSIGFQFKKFFIEAAHDFGLTNTYPPDSEDIRPYNRTFLLKIGYIFNFK